MLPWPTYHQPLQRWNCVRVQFRKSLWCLLLRSVCPESGLGFIGCFWLEGTSGVLSSSLLCQAGSAVRPDEVSESFNPVWYWKPPRMETTQPLWATCSHVWLASGKKSFHYNHFEWTSPVSAYAYLCLFENLLIGTGGLLLDPLGVSPAPGWTGTLLVVQLALYQDPQGLFSRTASHLVVISWQIIAKLLGSCRLTSVLHRLWWGIYSMLLQLSQINKIHFLLSYFVKKKKNN